MLSQLFRNMPGVVKNLLLINVMVFIITSINPEMMWNLALFYPKSDLFQPYQLITHMFTHGGLGHIFFNMFALVMFGSQLEMIWGPKKFLAFYLITGLGAVALHLGVKYFEVQELVSLLPNTIVERVFTEGMGYQYYDATIQQLNLIVNTPTVGASGAIYGLLVGFGMLFPNTELMLIFFPIPIKAKYFIPILIIFEIYAGLNIGDNIAHFAHLGGALFGFILILIWKKDRNNFY